MTLVTGEGAERVGGHDRAEDDPTGSRPGGQQAGISTHGDPGGSPVLVEGAHERLGGVLPFVGDNEKPQTGIWVFLRMRGDEEGDTEKRKGRNLP